MLKDRGRSVATRDDLVTFLAELAEDCGRSDSAWPNDTLESFLQGAAGWAQDMDGYYRNLGRDPADVSPWQVLADVLMAARVYE